MKNYNVTFQGGSISWGLKRPKYKKVSFTRSYRSSDCFNRTPEQLEKSRRRRITRLARKFASLKQKPSWFITFILDRHINRDWSLDDLSNCFNQWIKWLKKRYPRSWFIYVFEISTKCGFHVHLLGRFGSKKPSLENACSKWKKITGSKQDKVAQIDKYTEAHTGYMTKPAKAKKCRELIQLLGKKSFWGVVNQKNMPVYPKQEYVLNEDQMKFLKMELSNHIMNSDGPSSSLRQTFKECGSINYTKPAVLKKALRNMKLLWKSVSDRE